MRLAVQYADATLNTATQVVYNCGCGLYDRDVGNIRFAHRVTLVGYKYNNPGGNNFADEPEVNRWLGTRDDELNTSGTRGQFPDGDNLLDRLRDPDNSPVFLTRIYLRLSLIHI